MESTRVPLLHGRPIATLSLQRITRSAFFSKQLPGRIVFDHKQLNLLRNRCEGRCLKPFDAGTILEGSWYSHTNGHRTCGRPLQENGSFPLPGLFGRRSRLFPLGGTGRRPVGFLWRLFLP